MASHPPIVFHQHKHQHPDDEHRPRLPPIPDLRFELSYLRSIQPYIHFRTSKRPRRKNGDTEEDELKTEVAKVEWGHVVWATVRDQIISPLLQGTVWALISFYLTPYSARLAHSVAEHLPSRRR